MNPQKLKVVVAEDESLSRKRLIRLLQEAGCDVIANFSEGRGAFEWLQQHAEIDAVFLDIHMPNLDGLAILRNLGSQTPIVLTTAFSEHAVEAFDSEAVDYLLKPITASRLDRAIKRIQARHLPAISPLGATLLAPNSAAHLRYPVQAGEGVVLVDLHKTTYFEVENEVVWAHASTGAGTGTRMRTNWTSLGEVEAAFPQAGLLRLHRHLLIRPEAVIGLKSSTGGRAIVRMTGGDELEASRGGAPRLRERLGL